MLCGTHGPIEGHAVVLVNLRQRGFDKLIAPAGPGQISEQLLTRWPWPFCLIQLG